MPVDPVRLAAANLQARLASHAAGRGPVQRPAGAAAGVPSAVTQRVQALRPDDPQRRRKALGIFLEALFLREFGAGLVHDPAFPALVQAVQEQMESDEVLRRACVSFADLLLAGKVEV